MSHCDRVRKDDGSGKETDDELLAKCALAVPIIKILQLISTKVLEDKVPGIISKVGSFLKSKVKKCFMILFCK